MATFRTIVKKMIPTELFRQIEPTGHLVESIIMNARYGFPGRKLRVIGVTGTNGKTTTSTMIHRMLHEAGIKVALLTTVATGIGDDIVPQSDTSRRLRRVSCNAACENLQMLVSNG